MGGKRLFLLVVCVVLLGGVVLAGQPSALAASLFGIPVPSQLPGTESEGPLGTLRLEPDHLVHPCAGMFSEPPFTGLSPLSIAHVSGFCSGGTSTDPYGDIGVWQANGHSYVALSGFGLRMFYVINVDDPYNPVLLHTQPFPSGGTAGTSVFAFKQGPNNYVSATMRGSSTSGACGFFVYNVNDPSNPQLVGRKTGSDWCTVHEHFVSTDASGDADYAWLAMGSESGSLYKVVAVDLTALPTMTERGRYQRADASGAIFVHDSNVVGNRVFLAHWGGGVLVHDKATLANNVNPTPLNPLNSIRPSGFNVHHVVPTSDGNHLFIEDEFINASNAEKIKLYNITDISNPFYETGIIGTGTAATNRAHNMRIMPLGPGRDLLLVGWYQAGTRGFEVDTTVSPPVITETLSHQLRETTTGAFGNVWGVDYLPCTVRGRATTCIYGGDMRYGLVVDALDYDPALDPYNPEAQITNPTNGQMINTCSYTIEGTAHDYYSGVAQVEVSTDGGGTWSVATGTTNWSYLWNITADGPYSLRVRATDAAGNLMPPSAAVAVTVAGGCLAQTPTPTATSTPGALLVGHVTWQGRPAQPSALQELPVTLTLKLGAAEVNYPAQVTDPSGFFTVTVNDLANGTYDWRAKGPKYLANGGTVPLSGQTVTSLEMGLMRAGDCNNDNVTNATDFSIMRATFGKAAGDPGYDDRADFTGDNVVNALDFTLLRGSFGTGGAPPLSPVGGRNSRDPVRPRGVEW